jgi:acetyltransferase-like isoleucine patch superfamily enzyme
MTAHSLNAGFLSAGDLDALGVHDAEKRNIRIHSTAVIVNFDNIHFGENIRIDPYVVISCSNLVLGNHVHIATGCGLFGSALIAMDDFSGISAHGLIYSSSDDYSGKSLTNPTVPTEFLQTVVDNVVIGRHCIIGARATILPGCVLGEGAAVGSSALVQGALPPWTISVGIPAKPIKPRARDCLEREVTLAQWKRDLHV